MKHTLTTMEALAFWKNITQKAMDELQMELSPRQITLLLTVYLSAGPHTVKNLSASIGISKAAICRALDKLSMMNLVKRKKDKKDQRNVFVQRTIHGSVLLSDFADIITQEQQALSEQKKPELAD